jgi:hypothetical protein
LETIALLKPTEINFLPEEQMKAVIKDLTKDSFSLNDDKPVDSGYTVYVATKNSCSGL